MHVDGGVEIRASDADRDHIASLLNAALAEGRLTADEHAQRLDAAYAARTWSQLHQLTADLPAPTGQMVVPRMLGQPDLCLLCVLLIVCPPAGIAWWLLSRRADSQPEQPVAVQAGGRAPVQAGGNAQDR
jgi:uncharacterized protein DUF1707